jgi:hypothetical protein
MEKEVVVVKVEKLVPAAAAVKMEAVVQTAVVAF